MQRNSSSEGVAIGDEVHVWQAWLDGGSEELEHFANSLSPDEVARANRFHFEKDRNHYIVGRGLLRELLGRYLGQSPSALEFSYGEHGKPALAGTNAACGFSFNLSHSSGLAVYAFSRERSLGIDVEQTRPDFATEDIARRYFSTREVEDLLTLPAQERVQAFFRCWTRKEAYIKARGAGLQIPLDSFSVSLLPGQPAQLLSGVDASWHLAAFKTEEGYAAALVHDGAPCPISRFSCAP